MAIVSETIEINVSLPVDNNFIEAELIKKGVCPLRWAIVKVEDNILTISVACEDL